jgi:hypothetical protein
MKVLYKRCFLSFLLIGLFIRKILTTERHRFRATWLSITNWSTNAIQPMVRGENLLTWQLKGINNKISRHYWRVTLQYLNIFLNILCAFPRIQRTDTSTIVYVNWDRTCPSPRDVTGSLSSVPLSVQLSAISVPSKSVTLFGTTLVNVYYSIFIQP